jgi:hypothetical protein
MQKTIHLRWLRLKRQTLLTGPRAAQRRNPTWAPLPIFTRLASKPLESAAHLRPVLS